MIDLSICSELDVYLLAKTRAEKSFPFKPNIPVYKVMGKMFALISDHGINLKCNPDEALIWRSMYDGVTPAYHMNKEHWNSVILDGSVPNDLIYKMIDDSYVLICKKLSKRQQEGLYGV